MNHAGTRRAVFVDAGPQGSRRPADDARATLQLAEGLRLEGWTLVFRRGWGLGAWRSLVAARGRSDLVVAVLGEDRPRSVLWNGAILARWSSAPFVVVEDVPGALAGLRRSCATSLATLNIVTRATLRPADVPARLEAPLLTAIGAGPDAPPRNGLAPITLDDLDAVARLHEQAFTDSAMTRLGTRVVERYYRWQLIGNHPFPFAVGAWRDGQLVGFVFGGVRNDAVSGFVRRFPAAIAMGAISHPAGTRLLTGPKVAPVLRLIMRSPFGARQAGPTPKPDALAPGPSSFGILSIAVAPSAQGSGVADDLMAAAEAAAAEIDLRELNLTVNTENARAVRFYERTGWTRVSDGGTWTGRMTKQL